MDGEEPVARAKLSAIKILEQHLFNKYLLNTYHVLSWVHDKVAIDHLTLSKRGQSHKNIGYKSGELYKGKSKSVMRDYDRPHLNGEGKAQKLHLKT